MYSVASPWNALSIGKWDQPVYCVIQAPSFIIEMSLQCIKCRTQDLMPNQPGAQGEGVFRKSSHPPACGLLKPYGRGCTPPLHAIASLPRSHPCYWPLCLEMWPTAWGKGVGSFGPLSLHQSQCLWAWYTADQCSAKNISFAFCVQISCIF